MSITKPQLIFLGAILFVVVLAVLLFTCALPGLQSCSPSQTKIKAELTFWGLDEPSAYTSAFASFKTIYPEVMITYRGFADIPSYERTLLDALASGTGPDIFAVDHRALKQYENKITPLPATRLTLNDLRRFFPQTVEYDFSKNGTIYALPLFIDSLALIYNRDLMDASAVTPPTTWDDLARSIPRLILTSSSSQITRAAIALGEDKSSITNASDILSLLMMQNGAKMIDDQGNAQFATTEGVKALEFYTQFSDSRSPLYTWHKGLPFSRNALAQEKTAMILDYHSAFSVLSAQNPYLNIAVAPVPQLSSTGKPLARPTYHGLSVSKQSKNSLLAWEFIIKTATNEESARAYMTAAKKPPAHRTLLIELQNDVVYGPFARQALIARSWHEPNPTEISDIFSQMITSVREGRASLETSLKTAENKVNGFIKRGY